MKSHHDFETEVALVDDIKEKLPDLWAFIDGCSPFAIWGAYVYKITPPTPNAPSGRVIRILKTIWSARGCTFRRPKNYTERRDSDRKSLPSWKSSHRMTQSRWRQAAKGNMKIDAIKVEVHE
jgi:hypothetical protein